jgi:hypothetical protein
MRPYVLAFMLVSSTALADELSDEKMKNVNLMIVQDRGDMERAQLLFENAQYRLQTHQVQLQTMTKEKEAERVKAKEAEDAKAKEAPTEEKK